MDYDEAGRDRLHLHLMERVVEALCFLLYDMCWKRREQQLGVGFRDESALCETYCMNIDNSKLKLSIPCLGKRS